MPPRRSARVAAVVERESSALPPLPHALVHAIFTALPVDARARCAAVCRGWRAVLADPSFWLRLDLSAESGVTCAFRYAVLLPRAAAFARGQLQALDVSGFDHVAYEWLESVVNANAGCLRELRVQAHHAPELEGVAPFSAHSVTELLRAAPLLRDIDVSIGCDLPTALLLLRGEPPFVQLRLHQLRADLDGADAAVLLADVAACRAPLAGLSLERTPLDAPGALDALVDVVLARRPAIAAVKLTACRLSAASAPALARLLGNDALRVLHVCGREPGHDADLLDAPAAALLGAALRANTKLTSVAVTHLNFWRDAPAAAALLGALTGHPNLRSLHLQRPFPYNVSARRGRRARRAAGGGCAAVPAGPAVRLLG
jgi:hypothetical protein